MRRIALFGLIALMCCQHRHEDPAYVQEITKWQTNRATRLKAEDGWLSLVGLQWLNPAENKLEGFGTFTLNDGKVTYVSATGGAPEALPFCRYPSIANSRYGGLTSVVVMRDDTDPNGPTVLQQGTKRVTVIKRNEKFGLRIKDANSSARKHFLGLDYFPVNSQWRFVARFEPYNPPKKLPITNVLGMVSEETSPGLLAFDVDGKTWKVEPILEQGETDWFIIFKDATSGKETYGAARYVYAAPPGPDGTTVLDLNKAYNPPCAFTPYATCPLPPPQNKLPFRVEAGEKKYRGGHT
jgi:uncharacterized protein (DUF1684 family)